MKGLVPALFFCCFTGFTAGARDGLVLRANGLAAKSASETPVMPTNRAAKMRILKNADREVDFFFISGVGYLKWMSLMRRFWLKSRNAPTVFLFFPIVLIFTRGYPHCLGRRAKAHLLAERTKACQYFF
jgi:hypothetical protein